jgi:choline dehydrogenase
MPAALPFPIGSRMYDWRYETDPEPRWAAAGSITPAARCSGGSSSINGMIFQRGNPMDYERWAADPGHGELGLPALPALLQEDGGAALAAGSNDEPGAAATARCPGTWQGGQPALRAFFTAAEQAGFPRTSDVNGYRQEGFGPFDRNINATHGAGRRRGRTCTRRCRPNLTVRTLAHATRVLFRGTKAIGVEYRRGGRTYRAYADEVVLSGGAINTPQLLQLSGVGNREHLEPLGIEMVHHLPGVGENLQDHLEVYIQYASKQPVSIAPGLKWHRRPKTAADWLFFRKGLGATNHFEGGGFVRSNDDVDYPNLMFHFLPIAIRYDGTQRSPVGGHGYQVHIGPMYSDARGTSDHEHQPVRRSRRCCSTTCPPTRTARSGSRRSARPG